MRNELINKKILFTRELIPEHFQHARKLNLQIESIPLISTQSIPWNSEVSKSKEFLEADTLILSSRNAVSSIIEMEGLEFFVRFSNILCLGRKTAEELHLFQEKIHFPEEANSESLLQLIVSNPEYKNLVYLHGNLVDKSFSETLLRTSRKLVSVEVYHTKLNSTEIKKSPFSAIVFQSPSAVKAFFLKPKNSIPSNTPIFVPGRITEEAIKQYCKNKVVRSKSPNTFELLNTIDRYFSENNDSLIKTT